MKKPSILITGGAGYIGSHTAYLMSQNNYDVIILDSMLYNQDFNHKWATLIKGDFADKQILKNIFENYNIQAVMHFAALIEVGESVKNPLKFYKNNVSKTITLLDSMIEHNVKKFIFSSSCAVYGCPQWLPLTENHPKNPISPYGNNKLIVETMLQDCEKAYDLKYVNLRYFNAAGAMPEIKLGENHKPETHLIPLVLRAAISGSEFCVFGNNYETKDGSCIRDYIHVSDLANAHRLALEYLNAGNNSECFNLGTGNGFSVLQICEAVEKICCKKIKISYKNKREGDPAVLIASPEKALNILGWQAKHSSLENIISSAYAYEIQKLSNILENKIYKEVNE